MTSACGWVESTGGEALSITQAVDRQILTGVNDIVDIVAEEPALLDTTALLSRIRESRNQSPAPTVWQQIGSSDLAGCPHLRQSDTGVSLRQACDLTAYASNGIDTEADCSIHFVELADSSGIYEVNAPAITHPVVLRYEVTATTGDGLSNTSELTICLEP